MHLRATWGRGLIDYSVLSLLRNSSVAHSHHGQKVLDNSGCGLGAQTQLIHNKRD